MSPLPTDTSRTRPPAPGGRPLPPGPGNTQRPAPPQPGGRPTPPQPEVLVGPDTMAFLARSVDRNQNQLIDNEEGRVVGDVGNRNGVSGTGETARALNEGRGMLYGFQLLQNVAEALADRLTGGDAWLAKADFDVSDAAKSRLDENRDGRVSRRELADGLTRGGLAINAKAIMTADEAKARFNRPAPPRPDTDRPAPPSPGGTRPTPPRPDVDRPAPPRPGDRPTPPPVLDRSPQELASRFASLTAELKRTYDGTSMTSAEFAAGNQRLIAQVSDALVNETRSYPFAQRAAALKAIYDGSAMTSAQKTEIDRRLVEDAGQQLLLTPPGSWAQTKAALKALYDGSSMTSEQNKALEQRLIAKEVELITFGHFPSYMARRQALDFLYDNSSMTSSQKSEIARKLEQDEAGRVTRF